jgi:hypothetical protein
MTSGRDDKTGGPAAPPGEGDLFTSEDIFGDMLDDAGRDRSAGPLPAPRAASARKSPIKVKVGEAGPARKATPLSTPGEDGALPDDVAALLDAFSEPRAAAPKPGSETLPPVPRDRAPARPSAPPARAPVGMDSMVEDLLNLKKPAPGVTRTALPAPATARANETLPPTAARTATKFQAAPPRATQVPDGGGIDLAGLAEEAMTSPAPEAAAAPEQNATEARRPTDAYGPYRLLERVAVGGMAEVFRAKRSGVEGFEKVVAVKRILSHLSDNKEFVDMFIDEAKMVAGLTHANIVQMLDLGKLEKSSTAATTSPWSTSMAGTCAPSSAAPASARWRCRWRFPRSWSPASARPSSTRTASATRRATPCSSCTATSARRTSCCRSRGT